MKSPSKTLKHLREIKGSLTSEQKKKLIVGLKTLKKKIAKENAMTLSPQEPMNLDEDIPNKERNVISQTFTVDNEDFDSYINRYRGIQFTPKENDAILNFRNIVHPTAQDPFFVRFENVDDFGNNTTTVVKKFKKGDQFVFTAFSSVTKTPEPESEPEAEMPSPEKPPQGLTNEPTGKPGIAGKAEKPGSAAKPELPPLKEQDEMDKNQTLISKSIPFQDDTEGADILSDFLRKLDI